MEEKNVTGGFVNKSNGTTFKESEKKDKTSTAKSREGGKDNTEWDEKEEKNKPDVQSGVQKSSDTGNSGSENSRRKQGISGSTASGSSVGESSGNTEVGGGGKGNPEWDKKEKEKSPNITSEESERNKMGAKEQNGERKKDENVEPENLEKTF